jgi:deoxycytidylate deaminase
MYSDVQVYASSGRADLMTDLRAMEQSSRLTIINASSSADDLREEVQKLDITNPERLRPGWDAYFMALACLASERTNCMKRRVGCVIVRDRRIVATGYNGTPSGVLNCIEGGCARCNGSNSTQGVGLDLCLCLHAEENAIIEAGRERCEGSVLYTNLFPCLLCAKVRGSAVCGIKFSMRLGLDLLTRPLLDSFFKFVSLALLQKIIQAGIRKVVYQMSYATDESSATLLEAGRVLVESHASLGRLG